MGPLRSKDAAEQKTLQDMFLRFMKVRREREQSIDENVQAGLRRELNQRSQPPATRDVLGQIISYVVSQWSLGMPEDKFDEDVFLRFMKVGTSNRLEQSIGAIDARNRFEQSIRAIDSRNRFE